jgi:hypothetical protein
VPSLEGPRGDKVDLLPPLAFYSLYRLGALEVLTTLMHLGIDVSDSILQPLHLFQLAMQLLLQLTIPMYFGAESVVSEASQSVINPVLTPIVMVEDLHPLSCRRCGFFRRKVGCSMGQSLIDRGSRGRHAQGIGIVGHMNGDVFCLHLVAIVEDLEGDVAWGYIESEFFW